MLSNSKLDAQKQGRAIQKWRIIKNQTQAILAKKIGMPRPVLSHIETGKVFATDETLIKISRALKCFVADLDIEPSPEQIKESNETMEN